MNIKYPIETLLIIITIPLFLGITSPAKSGEKKKLRRYTISGKVTQTRDYCGGAQLREEMVSDIAKPAPYTNKKFFVRYGTKNTTTKKVLLSFITDDSGYFSFKLPSGIYAIIQEPQVHPLNDSDYINENLSIDLNCLKKWWSKPYYILKVNGKNKKNLNFSFHHRCFVPDDIPCIEYIGPSPP